MKTTTIKLEGVKHAERLPFHLANYLGSKDKYTLQTRRGMPVRFLGTIENATMCVVCATQWENGEEVSTYSANGQYNIEQGETSLDLFMCAIPAPEIYYYVAGEGLLAAAFVVNQIRQQSTKVIIEFV